MMEGGGRLLEVQVCRMQEAVGIRGCDSVLAVLGFLLLFISRLAILHCDSGKCQKDARRL